MHDDLGGAEALSGFLSSFRIRDQEDRLMIRTAAFALLIALAPVLVHAEEPSLAAPAPAGGIRASIDRIRIGDPNAYPFTTPPPSGRKNGTAQKVTAGVALGIVGMFAGGWLGARIEGNSCHCDDPGLKGAMIGIPIGAIVGAIAGVRLASQ
jgi:hypothetical protein